MKSLLIETHPFHIHKGTLTEGIGGAPNTLIVEGILATAEIKNGNGRYYPRSLWEREMAKYKELVDSRRSLGELDHPESQVVNLKNASHLVKDFWWEGDNVIGQIEILSTPSGNILKELIKNQVSIGVSSRGMGSLEQNNGVMEVQDDFQLLCWDFVSNPSNPGSYMSTLNESKTIVENNYNKINEIIHEILCSKGSCPII